MSDTNSNVEFAHKVSEHGRHHELILSRNVQWVEILEALVLAIVAIATAWSGYQAARWEALSAKDYAIALQITVRAQERNVLGGQSHLYDIIMFNSWLNAKRTGKTQLAADYERRFRPEFLVAFTAWQKLDPFNNPSAPPGPSFMTEYVASQAREAAVLSGSANAYFEQGVETRHQADSYVKLTVFLATVLLLTALSQKFKSLQPRVAVLAVAFIMLAFSSYWILTFPRA